MEKIKTISQNKRKPGKTSAALLTSIAAIVIGISGMPQSFAQYGDNGAVGITTPAQLEECKKLLISEANCNDNTILAARKSLIAYENPDTGSGTHMLAGETGTMIAFMAVLGAMFGGVATAFFLKGRSGRKVPS